MQTSQDREFAKAVVERLRRESHQAFWAGGCVRDTLLGRPPEDFDVATSAHPEEVRRIFGERRTLQVGEAFGVVVVLGPPRVAPVEVATFRKDAAYSDGRHPDSVEYASAVEDAHRRDFTINGMFLDPVTSEVVDFVGGREDLAAGLIRAIGNADARISEDKLRMLRAVRFATQLDFHVEAATQQAIAKRAKEIALVSAERIGMEMRAILRHRNRARGVQLLDDCYLLPVVAPPLANTDRADCWRQTLAALDALGNARFEVALAALIVCRQPRDQGAAIVAAIRGTWRLTNREAALITWLIAKQQLVRDAAESTWPIVQPLLVHQHVDLLLQLGRALAVAASESRAGIEFCERKLELPRVQLDPPPLLNGDDLRSHGIPPGKILCQDSQVH